ncbi:MAG: fibronectin type III domain-containing protein [Patescibacteria group bacterium]|jgi:hypothetical protein
MKLPFLSFYHVVTLLALCLLLLQPHSVWAADLTVECSSGNGCSVSGTEPLFGTQDGLWYPGRIVSKTLKLKNAGGQTRTMAIRANRKLPLSLLEQVMHLSVTQSGGGIIWAGSLQDFYDREKVDMGIYNPGVEQEYAVSASMDSQANNNYQGLSSEFDLTLGFWEEEVEPSPSPTPTVTPIPPSSPGPISTPSGTGGGTVLGVTAPVCNDLKPGSAPVLTSAVATGPNEVTLSWIKADDPVTYYLVAFGTEPGVMKYGNPNVGGPNTTAYTVNGLSGGTTYYFRVRAGNGCMPGDFSNELSAIPGGVVLLTTPEGFTEGVLGKQTENKELLEQPGFEPVGQVAGVAVCSEYPYWWWLPLVTQGILMSLYYLFVQKRQKKMMYVVVPVFLTGLSYYIHTILGCNCATGRLCPFYWVFSLLILCMFLASFYLIFRRQTSHSN